MLHEPTALAYDPLAPLLGVPRGLSRSASDVALTRWRSSTQSQLRNPRESTCAYHRLPNTCAQHSAEGAIGRARTRTMARGLLTLRPPRPLASGRRCSDDLRPVPIFGPGSPGHHRTAAVADLACSEVVASGNRAEGSSSAYREGVDER